MKNRFKSPVLLLLLGLLLGALNQCPYLKEWEESTVDMRLMHRPSKLFYEDLGVVAVEDDDIEHPQFGGWPFQRTVHADVIRILRALGSTHITFDVVFSDPTTPADDEALITTIASKNDVTLAFHFDRLDAAGGDSMTTENGSFSIPGHRYGVDVKSTEAWLGVDPKPLFADFQCSFGAVNVKADSSNRVIRHVPMYIQYQGKLYPGLAMQTLIQTLQLEPDQIRIEPGKQIQLVDTPRGNLVIPIDEKMQYRINFTSGAKDFKPVFQYLDLYEAVDNPELADKIKKALNGKPVIVGNSSTGTSDVVTTPLGRLPGMLAQATAIGNILTQDHLKFPPGWMQILGCGLLGLMLGLCLLIKSARGIVAVTILFAGICLAIIYFLSTSNWMIPVIPVLALSLIGMTGALWSQIDRARNETGRTLRALNKYVSPAVAQRALREEAFATAPNERREVTIFFSDIRGFTQWSESKEPEEVTLVLNEYLSAMTDVVSEVNGTLDKFVGDAIMVVFNAPDDMENHAFEAVRMAVKMQIKIGELSELWRAKGREPIRVGMGINTGYATVGNFGSEIFSDYTAIGNSVNLAARIESVSSPAQILLSDSTNTLVKNNFKTKFMTEHQLKGISDAVPVYEVIYT